jgi:glycosyltransferase involved in cell wall biosynthesis
MISVIIPLYNREHLISYTLQSLSAENHPDVSLEVILIDDNSTDNGVLLIKQKFSWVNLITNTINKGASACRNQGLKLAKGQHVFFIDSDDLVEPGFFFNRVMTLVEDPKLIGAYGPWTHFETEANYTIDTLRPRKSQYPLHSTDSNQLLLRNLLSGWFVPINATIWHTDVVRISGGFSESLKINQDVDFFFRMLQLGPIAGVDSPKALIRIHKGERVGQTISEEKLLQILNLRKYFYQTLEEKNLSSLENREALASYLLNMWALYRNAYPVVAKACLNFSKDIYPDLQLKGSVGLRLLSKLVGIEKAIVFKQFFRS